MSILSKIPCKMRKLWSARIETVNFLNQPPTLLTPASGPSSYSYAQAIRVDGSPALAAASSQRVSRDS